jgi:RimJ/RimL family protein N-acetyltransferase
MIVRPGTTEDIEAIAELIERVDRARFVRSESEWERARMRVHQVLSSEGSQTFVAERDGALVGELLAVPREPGVVGIGVSVAVGSRRSGVATELFAAVFAWAREAGLRELELEVQEANEPARALYAKLGFVDRGRRRPGERGPVLTLTKSP